MRGRLIFSFRAQIFRADPVTTRNVDPDGSGRGGFDDDFKEPVLVDHDGDGVSDFKRSELEPVLIPCQVEPVANEVLRMTGGGDSPASSMALVFHFADLERLGLVDSTTGEALIRKGDRLGSLVDRSGVVVQTFPDPPGLYVVESRPIGFGLGLFMSRRNLLFVKFGDRSARGL